MVEFDINFDFRNDSICGDPDTDSLKLYEIHKLLWTKNLFNGKFLELDVFTINGKYGRILLKSNLCDNLSSDRMCPHFVGRYSDKFEGWLNEEEKKEFEYKVRTIGGHIVFPAHRKNGFTIKQARGVNKNICDRFDLTLECIRRFYKKETSPLYETILRYNDFFSLFESFQNYINFFLLQDFVDEEYNVKFCVPFGNFHSTPLPSSKEEYIEYKNNTIQSIDLRNERIKKVLQKI